MKKIIAEIRNLERRIALVDYDTYMKQHPKSKKTRNDPMFAQPLKQAPAQQAPAQQAPAQQAPAKQVQAPAKQAPAQADKPKAPKKKSIFQWVQEFNSNEDNGDADIVPPKPWKEMSDEEFKEYTDNMRWSDDAMYEEKERRRKKNPGFSDLPSMKYKGDKKIRQWVEEFNSRDENDVEATGIVPPKPWKEMSDEEFLQYTKNMRWGDDAMFEEEERRKKKNPDFEELSSETERWRKR